MGIQSKDDKAQARNVVAQFYTAICRMQSPGRQLIQKSYPLHAIGVKIQALLNMHCQSYKIVHSYRKGENMIQFSVEVRSTSHGKFTCNPNVIREGDTWGINPVLAMPSRERVL